MSKTVLRSQVDMGLGPEKDSTIRLAIQLQPIAGNCHEIIDVAV